MKKLKLISKAQFFPFISIELENNYLIMICDEIESGGRSPSKKIEWMQ
jgi:hypothetical protein